MTLWTRLAALDAGKEREARDEGDRGGDVGWVAYCPGALMPKAQVELPQSINELH